MMQRPPTLSLGVTGSPIKRSKSLSAADMRQHTLDATTPSMPDLGPFSPDVQSNISKTMTGKQKSKLLNKIFIYRYN